MTCVFCSFLHSLAKSKTQLSKRKSTIPAHFREFTGLSIFTLPIANVKSQVKIFIQGQPVLSAQVYTSFMPLHQLFIFYLIGAATEIIWIRDSVQTLISGTTGQLYHRDEYSSFQTEGYWTGNGEWVNTCYSPYFT